MKRMLELSKKLFEQGIMSDAILKILLPDGVVQCSEEAQRTYFPICV